MSKVFSKKIVLLGDTAVGKTSLCARLVNGTFDSFSEPTIGADYKKEYSDIFNKTDVFIIELCSLKKYIHNNNYLHHLSVDKTRGWYHKTDSTILNDSIIDKQTDEEIENDILEIQKLLYPKKIIIVSHYNANRNGKVLQSRNKLICLLEKICKKYNICFVNPTIILKSYNQSDVLNNDLGHYTVKGASLFTNYMNSIVNNLL